RHTRFSRDWSSDVCSSDLGLLFGGMLLGGTIRGGEIETQPPGVYPRIALSSSTNMLTFEGSSTGYFRVYPVGPVFQLEIVHGSRSEERRVGKECSGWGER